MQVEVKLKENAYKVYIDELEELEFDSLEISGSKIKNDEKPFVAPGATSTREDIGSDTQS
uniref:hypothetical protein n=1 Tax=Campylobacter jejuni TaxID=197 RepID=UPI00224284CD